MFPFNVDPGWYDEYWMSDQPRSPRRPYAGSLARFAVVVALLAGSGLVLGHVHQDASGYQDWEQE